MIKGTYKFYIDNELVAEKNNALTTAGRTIAIKSLLGIIPSFAGTMAYGISGKPNSISASTSLITDNSLQFELGRAAVIGSSLNIFGLPTSNLIVSNFFKAYLFVEGESHLFLLIILL